MYDKYDNYLFVKTVTILIYSVPILKILYVYKQAVTYFISVVLSVATCNL